MNNVQQSSVWQQHNPVRITAGPGALAALPELLPATGRLLLVTTPGFSARGIASRICNYFATDRVVVFDQVQPNPELDMLDEITHTYRQHDISGVVGLGGGSAVDAAKVLGLTLAWNQDRVLESMFRKKHEPGQQKPLPVCAVPATSGPGAEVTPFATVWDSVCCQKYSLANSAVWPEHALLDPELTLSLPVRETLYTGLDAVSHAAESLWNKNRTPVSTAYALHALELAHQNLPLLLNQPRDLPARSSMQHASLLAGLAISQTRTALAHSISYPLTIYFQVPHGLACSFTLPELITWYTPDLAQGHEKQLLEAIRADLDSFNLGQEIAKYVEPEQALGHLPEMFNPQRADNYIIKVSQTDVASLVQSSIAP